MTIEAGELNGDDIGRQVKFKGKWYWVHQVVHQTGIVTVVTPGGTKVQIARGYRVRLRGANYAGLKDRPAPN